MQGGDKMTYKEWFDNIPYEVREDALRTWKHELQLDEFMSKYQLKAGTAYNIITAVRHF